MNRLFKLLAGIAVLSATSPSSAFAYENQLTPFALHVTVSAVGLVFAVALLVQALQLRKVTLGGAIAEKIHLIVLAILCLAASALAKWTSNFVSGVTLAQTELAGEMLVALAMALLAGYFYSVRSAMQAYIAGAKATVRTPPVASAESAVEAEADSRA
jgi:hypothetical protein